MMKTILIVEDEPDIQELLCTYLRDAGYETAAAGDGVLAVELFRSRHFDLVLLDVMLPKIDGFGVCELIRRQSQVPILMVTALDGEDQQLRGFSLDVDDYITKPFSMPIVVRHIEAVLRRTQQDSPEESNIIHYKNIILNVDNFTVMVNKKFITLTTREFEILRFLLENQGKVITRESLMDSVWGYEHFGDEKIVNTHIKNIRKKLGSDYIKTIRGVGYKIEKED